MEHYLKSIEIKQLRHLSDIMINLDEQNRQHLLVTGKNGSGKTALLLAMYRHLDAIIDKRLEKGHELDLFFNEENDLWSCYRRGDFVMAYFPADRKIQIERSRGVADVKLSDFYGLDEEPGNILLKYMVHLKTQQSYAKIESDLQNEDRIQKWFDRFESALRILFDDETIKLEYNYKEYDFKIHQSGREAFGFDQLSDGYSSVIHIVSDLIMRMDKNWILKNNLSQYDVEGIVLIDELESHLHIELQKKILPFLTEFFPRIQFIVTTHSPYILNSILNAKAYDLEKNMELDNLAAYSSEDLAEACVWI